MADPTDGPGALIIGEGVLAKGSFEVPGRAIINGTVEGELKAKELVIGATGRGIGKFTAESGEVRGEILETIVVSRALIVRATGRVSGNVFYRELEIEKGGCVQGTLSQDVESERVARSGAAPVSAAASASKSTK